ncbi:MAG: tripartite tricarboxylate transporter substrate binding protein [Syntrophaceae bacterium]|nr:tripartite tricarboxylate transporter substrate binding protein [Syntrophaceae bacterium]
MLRKFGVMQNRWVLSSLTLLMALSIWSIDPGKAIAAWPEKQVELINPFGAGGAADVQARKLAEIISRELGQPLVVRNVTGAGGAIAYNEVHRAKPDGYTLIWYSGAINTLAARKQVKFDHQAFEPIAGVGFETIAIAVNKTASWKDIKEFISYIKQNPNKVTVGNSGIGSVTHMVPVAMASKIGAPVIHVPFGTGLAVAALMGGKIDASSQHPTEVLSQVRAGEVRVLAVSSEKRISLWPNVPTLKESGVDLAYDQWRGFAAPKGTPKTVIDKMIPLVKKAIESKEWIDFTASIGTASHYQDPEAFGKFVAEMDKITKEIVAAAEATK